MCVQGLPPFGEASQFTGSAAILVLNKPLLGYFALMYLFEIKREKERRPEENDNFCCGLSMKLTGSLLAKCLCFNGWKHTYKHTYIH